MRRICSTFSCLLYGMVARRRLSLDGKSGIVGACQLASFALLLALHLVQYRLHFSLPLSEKPF